MRESTKNASGVEGRVVEFGNGAHITLPKEWVDEMVRVERLGPWVPEAFSSLSAGQEARFEFMFGNEEMAVDGVVSDDGVEVIEVNETTMISRVLFEVETNGENIGTTYRVVTRRSVGDDGWVNEYVVSKDMTKDEMDEYNEVFSMDGDGMWKELGELTAISPRQSV